jgi:hypothetical protein
VSEFHDGQVSLDDSEPSCPEFLGGLNIRAMPDRWESMGKYLLGGLNIRAMPDRWESMGMYS